MNVYPLDLGWTNKQWSWGKLCYWQPTPNQFFAPVICEEVRVQVWQNCGPGDGWAGHVSTICPAGGGRGRLDYIGTLSLSLCAALITTISSSATQDYWDRLCSAPLDWFVVWNKESAVNNNIYKIISNIVVCKRCWAHDPHFLDLHADNCICFPYPVNFYICF